MLKRMGAGCWCCRCRQRGEGTAFERTAKKRKYFVERSLFDCSNYNYRTCRTNFNSSLWKFASASASAAASDPPDIPPPPVGGLPIPRPPSPSPSPAGSLSEEAATVLASSLASKKMGMTKRVAKTTTGRARTKARRHGFRPEVSLW